MRKGLIAALVAVAAILPAAAGSNAVTRPATARAATATASPIKHVVVLYLENHSFDSMLGFWCDNHPRRCPDGGMPSSVTLSNGAVVKPYVMPDVVPVVKHTIPAQRAAIHGGAMDGWQHVGGCSPSQYRCVGGYRPRQVPNLASLANAFAISDKTLSMADSPSWGGHLYAALASLDGFLGNGPRKAKGVDPGPGWGCDSDKVTGWRAHLGSERKLVPSCVPDPSLNLPNGGAFRPTPVSYMPTIFDRIHSAGRSWRIYGQPNPIGGLGKTGYVWDICPVIAECLYTGQHAHNVPSTEFVPDAQAGQLPNFAIIIPGSGDYPYSEHNGFSMTAGDDWLGQIASAVMNGPEWKSTALFITWDDCGCFYDQVVPGTNPDGTQQGPRVPLVIVSPYAKPGYTDTTSTTFAGILAYTEHNFGLAPLGDNDAQAYPFTHAFNYAQAPLPPVPMTRRPVPPGDHIDWAQARQDT
jgi:phospholipase C